jgi:hypothetical protein
MELTLGERITLLGILPKEANFVNLKIIRSLQEKMSFSEEEIKEYDIKSYTENDNVGYSWSKKGIEYKLEIEFGEHGTSMISSELKKLDKEEKLSSQNFTLYEKFIE